MVRIGLRHGAAGRGGNAHGEGPVEADAATHADLLHVRARSAADVENGVGAGQQVDHPLLVRLDLWPAVDAFLPPDCALRVGAAVHVRIGRAHHPMISDLAGS